MTTVTLSQPEGDGAQAAAGRISLRDSRRILGIIWLLAGGVLLVLFAVQTMLGKYGADSNRAWSWLLPNLLPTLSLVVGALVFENSKSEVATVDKTALGTSVALSVIYLGLLLATVFVQPLVEARPTDFLERTKVFLAPIQGLVALALGAFFVSRRD